MQDKFGLLSAPIPAVLRQMTVPMVFGMVAVLLFNVVDTFFVSLLGTQALAAMSFTFPITFAVNCITMGMGVGISTSIARLLGQGSQKDAAQFACHGLILTTILVILASTISIATLQSLFKLLGAAPSLLPLIDDYMFTWFLAVPLLVIPMAGNSAIRATGDTKTPAKIMMISGLANGILDPLLIFGWGPIPEFGIQGAALASGISWVIALIWSLYILIWREKLVSWPSVTRFINDIKQILHIGTPAALSNAMNPLAAAVLMRILADNGNAAVAAYGAAQRIESLMLIVLMSLTSILTPFMSQNFGANNSRRSFEALFLSMRFAILFQLTLFIMMVPLSIPLSTLFSQEAEVKNLLWYYLLIVPIGYGFQGNMMMLVSTFNALRKPLHAFMWSALRLFVLTLPCAWFGNHWFGVIGLFCGLLLANIVGGIIGYLQAIKLRNEHTVTV